MRIRKLPAGRLYLLAMFVLGLSSSVAFTTHVIYRVEVVGMDALQLVLAGTALEASIFLFEVPTGVVADIYSRRLSTIVGFFITGIGITLEGLAPLAGMVMLSQFIWGFGWTFVSGAFSAWITDEVGADRAGDYFLRGRQLTLFGNLLGIANAVWISRLSLSYPFMVGGALRVLFGFFLIAFMAETGFTPVPKEERQGWRSMFTTFSEGVALVRGRAVLITFSVIALLLGLYSEAWDRLHQAFLLQQFHFPTLGNLNLDNVAWFGILNTAIILIGILANEVAKRRVDTSRSLPITRALQVVYATMVLAILAYVFVPSFYLAVGAMLLFSAMRGVSFPLSEAWLNQHVSSKLRATVLSMAGQVDAFGELASGPLMGTVGRLVSMRAAIIGSALILSPVPFLYRRVQRQKALEE